LNAPTDPSTGTVQIVCVIQPSGTVSAIMVTSLVHDFRRTRSSYLPRVPWKVPQSHRNPPASHPLRQPRRRPGSSALAPPSTSTKATPGADYLTTSLRLARARARRPRRQPARPRVPAGDREPAVGQERDPLGLSKPRVSEPMQIAQPASATNHEQHVGRRQHRQIGPWAATARSANCRGRAQGGCATAATPPLTPSP
jgi:hypothetical protein